MYCSINLGPGRLTQMYSDSLWSLVFQPSSSRGLCGWLSYRGASSERLLSQTARFCVLLVGHVRCIICLSLLDIVLQTELS